MQPTICLTGKPQIAPPKDVIEIVWNALENALKNRLKGANGCKIWPFKNWKYEWKCKRENDKCVWGTPDDIIQGALDNTTGVAPKDAQEGTPDVALKGTLLVGLELHLFMQ